MAGIRSLVKDTAIYGLSSIVGRFLNWLLVPLYTAVFAPEAYGIVTYVYSVVALAMAVLTYGMETGFFRFANHERWSDPMEVYSTCLISLAATSALFVAAVGAFLRPISDAMDCAGHPSFVMIMAVCVALDAFLAIPYSYLRYRKRPVRFATVRLTNIGVNIGLNLFFILLCPQLAAWTPDTIGRIYNPDFGIGYIFLSNLIASVVNMLMMLPELRGFRWRFNPRLWREMLTYSAPLLVLSVAGIMNQTVDKILYPLLVGDPAEAAYGLGIYGANYKVAIVMVMFLQAFRFAYEPFIFSRDRGGEKTRERAYADAMKYFVIFALAIFLAVMFFLNIVRHFISSRYYSGLDVVPVIMLAELFFGIFFNLSLWYKLTDRTVWGMWFSLLGLAVTLVMNVLLVPRMGYMGCAWAALTSYGVMMLASYFIGRAKHPIGYETGRILSYFGITAGIYAVGMYALPAAGLGDVPNGILRAALIVLYVAIVIRREHLPVAALVKSLANRLHR